MAAEAQKRREEEAAARAAERSALRRMQRNFAVRAEGSVSVDKAAKVSLS